MRFSWGILRDGSGFSPRLFQAILAAGCHLLTCRKGRVRRLPARRNANRFTLDTSGFKNNSAGGAFSLRLRDKSVVFAPNGRAAITYRVEVGVCLASGDPVGDPRYWPQAIAAWLELCRDYGWAPGAMGASSAAAQAYREAGLNALQLGDEAILYPDKFRLSGPDMKAVRQAVTRAKRAGLTVRMRRHRDIPEAEMAEVISRADAWRDTETERGFSMALGRLGGLKGGKARAKSLTASQRKASARRAAVARWSRAPEKGRKSS